MQRLVRTEIWKGAEKGRRVIGAGKINLKIRKDVDVKARLVLTNSVSDSAPPQFTSPGAMPSPSTIFRSSIRDEPSKTVVSCAISATQSFSGADEL